MTIGRWSPPELESFTPNSLSVEYRQRWHGNIRLNGCATLGHSPRMYDETAPREKPRHVRFWFVLASAVALSGALTDHASRWLRPPPARGEEAETGPLAAYAFPASERMRFEGRVVARLVAGSYTYLEIERTDGDRAWVVTLSSSRGASAEPDDAVQITAIGYADHFVSKRLGRSFPGLYFAVVRTG